MFNMSRQWVPWPGKRTTSTANPFCARASPSGRVVTGLPVKPWLMTMPIEARGPSPGDDHDSAPAITGNWSGMARSLRLRLTRLQDGLDPIVERGFGRGHDRAAGIPEHR